MSDKNVIFEAMGVFENWGGRPCQIESFSVAQGDHCDQHTDLGGIWNLVSIAITGEGLASGFRPDLLAIPRYDTPTWLCAEPRSRVRHSGSRPVLKKPSTGPKISLLDLYGMGLTQTKLGGK